MVVWHRVAGFFHMQAQIAGFRIVVLFKVEDVSGLMEAATMKSVDAVADFIMTAGDDVGSKLLALPGTRHGTMTPGSALVVPSGYVEVYKTLGMPVFGVKRTLMPNSDKGILELHTILNAKEIPSKAGTLALDILRKILVGRFPKQSVVDLSL